MRLRIWIALGLAVASIGAFPSRGKYAGSSASGTGTLAMKSQLLVNAIGFNTHIFNNPGLYTSSNINADMAYLGVHNIRDYGYTNATTYNAIGAAGGVFDGLEGTAWNSCSGTSTASYLSGMTSAFNTQVAANPGSLGFVEGPNEINNQPVCYLTTAVATNTSGPLNFAVNGDTQPLTDYPTAGASFYDSVGNSTWVAWNGYNGAVLNVYVQVYNHSTSTWSSAVIVDQTPLGTDQDAGPGIVMDQYGYVHIFYGAHNTNIYYKVSTTARSPSAWTTGSQISTSSGFTYMSPVLLSGKIYMLTTSQPSGNQDIVIFSGTPSAGGTPIASWSSPTQITNFTGSKVWAGNLVIKSNSICFPYTNHVSGAESEGVFYSCYNTSTGALTDISGGTSIPSGSLPVSAATAISDFQLVPWPGSTYTTVIPSQAIDNNGITHVLYTKGLDGSGNMVLYEAYYSSGAWTTGVAVGGHTGDDSLQPTIAPTPTGVQAFWGQSSNYPTTLDAAYTATSTALGTWGAPAQVIAAGNYSLDMFSTITNAASPNNPTPFLVAFSEQNQPGTPGPNNNLKLFVYGGTSGAIVNFTSAPASVQAVAGAGFGSGIAVTDITNPSAIPNGTTVSSATATSVTLSNSTSVSFGDTIQFEANQTNPASGIAWQTDIYNAIHADSNLSGIPVLNFTDFPNYGVAGTADRNNAHIYATFGSQPGNKVSGWQYLIEYGQSNTIAGLPLLVTETGWYTVNSGTDGVDLNTQARYSLNALFDLYVAFSVPQVYFYEGIDEGTDGNPGNHYGLFDNSNNPKVVAFALKNLVTIMADTGGAFAPGRLNYSVTGLSAPSGSWPTGNAGGYSALFEKANGRFYIVIWNEPQIWNYNTQAEVTPPTSSLTVGFGQTITTVHVYDPITGSTPTNTYSGVMSISASIAADPLIVEVIP